MGYMHESDETLVMLTLAGEQKAYEVLVTRHEKSVIATAKSITHNAFMAEDSAQDAFVTAWMKLNTLQQPDRFVYWVRRIAKNCALNMVNRFRLFIPFCDIENTAIVSDADADPEAAFVRSEERAEMQRQVDKLPEKVKKIIYLHYYDGLSIAEIADRMRIPEGTVKWQLHDGRKRIRKELCAVNEKVNDTLTEKVIKKVEELKLWQRKNKKDGFEKVYSDVLSEVEKLPESKKRYYALADVLMRGWWWLPGDKNDALFARIKEAAVAGKNEEVMKFITRREDGLVPGGGAREDFVRNKQIPYLEKTGFVEALAAEWMRLGLLCLDADNDGRRNMAREAFEKAKTIVPRGSMYAALAQEAVMLTDDCASYRGKDGKSYRLGTRAYDLRKVDGELCFWAKEYGASDGWITSICKSADDMFRNASYCDGKFFESGLAVGGTVIGSDGTTLTYESADERVDTPCGLFENCRLWKTECRNVNGKGLLSFRTYYKDGVGIVRQETCGFPVSETRTLCAYSIVGGEGLLPLAVGNTWEYRSDHDDNVVRLSLRFTVTAATENSAVIVSRERAERLQYDDRSWIDMMRQIRSDYCAETNGHCSLCDVSHAVERAETLADTPFRKAHTRAALSVIRRIMDTDDKMTPDCKATGHWNFFDYESIVRKDGRTDISSNRDWCFEYKCTNGSAGCEMTLYNDIYGLLSNSANAIWSDEWRIGAEPTVEFDYFEHIRSRIRCEHSAPVTTKAGTFDHCIKLSISTTGLEQARGRQYRGLDKTYYFAEGIGIVRADFVCLSGVKTVTYELTAYEGRGEGYMPLADGMMRRYDGVDIPDGYVSSAVYTYAMGDDGELVILADRCGIRVKPPHLTDYSDIYGEVREEELWDKKAHGQSRMLHDVNNFRIMVHYLERTQRYHGKPEKAVAWQKNVIRTIETFGADGEVPRAWLKKYMCAHFICGTALCGAGRKEEGYAYIEKAFALSKKVAALPKDEPMEVGDQEIFGGVKIVPSTGEMILPDGSRDVCGEWSCYGSAGWMYAGMTAVHGWAWFDPVRDDDRFRALLERVRELMDEESV